ncbi:MAG: tetratricopeptide repeat protein [Desulfovibrionaceae bacterium]|nr:tetratricopeptide repeat protein [Desulfovibrionaceae bacterium]
MGNQMDYEINKELGECYLFMGDYDKAEDYYRKAASNNPDSAAPFMGLATIAVQRADLDTALVLYQKAAQVEATDKAYCGIGLVYMEKGQHEDAFSYFAKSLDLNAKNIVSLNCLVREAYQLNKVEQTLGFLENAMDETPEGEAIRVTLAGCLMTLGRNAEAKIHLEKALANNPSNTSARELIATLAA